VSSQVLRSSTVQTSLRDHAEFVLDTLRYVEPMKLGVCQMCQAAVKLPAIAVIADCRPTAPLSSSDMDTVVVAYVLTYCLTLSASNTNKCKFLGIQMAKILNIRSADEQYIFHAHKDKISFSPHVK